MKPSFFGLIFFSFLFQFKPSCYAMNQNQRGSPPLLCCSVASSFTRSSSRTLNPVPCFDPFEINANEADLTEKLFHRLETLRISHVLRPHTEETACFRTRDTFRDLTQLLDRLRAPHRLVSETDPSTSETEDSHCTDQNWDDFDSDLFMLSHFYNKFPQYVEKAIVSILQTAHLPSNQQEKMALFLLDKKPEQETALAILQKR